MSTWVDREAPLRFIRTAYEQDDWVAVFLKSWETVTNARVGACDSSRLPRSRPRWIAGTGSHRSASRPATAVVRPALIAQSRACVLACDWLHDRAGRGAAEAARPRARHRRSGHALHADHPSSWLLQP